MDDGDIEVSAQNSSSPVPAAVNNNGMLDIKYCCTFPVYIESKLKNIVQIITTTGYIDSDSLYLVPLVNSS